MAIRKSIMCAGNGFEDAWSEKHSSWVVHRPDYQRILAQAALDAGAQIEFSIKIARIEVEACRIHLEDGTTINCDLIVGADGKSSLHCSLCFRPWFDFFIMVQAFDLPLELL